MTKAKGLGVKPGVIRDIYKLGGFYWHDNTGGEYALSTHSLANDNLGAALKYVKNKNVVIQAGGYTGIWPVWLSREFRRVYTFEPEINNFRALVANCPYQNVFAFRAFLGNERDFVSILDNCHSGSCRVNVASGPIPVMVIDEFGFDACDLIQLDVERYEFPILYGARETIQKYKPIIMVEALSKRPTDPYPFTYDDVISLMDTMDYKILHKVNKDVIWGPK
jgi:FkbM family methyltransferase